MSLEDENDPYNRWQGLRIAQLGVCVSLFLTFSVATLGFSASLLVQEKYWIVNCFAKVFFFLSFLCGLLSLLLGSVVCLTRLGDFRATANVARHRLDHDMAGKCAELRTRYKRFGWWTWKLFYSTRNVRPTGDPVDTRSRDYLLESANLTVRAPWRKSKYCYSPEFSASCSGWHYILDHRRGGLLRLTPSVLLLTAECRCFRSISY